MDSIEKQPEETSEEDVLQQGKVTSKVIAKNVQMKSGIAGTINAEEDVTMTSSVALVVAAGKDLVMNQSKAQLVAAGKDLEATDCSFGLAPIGQDLHLENGSIGLANAGKEISIEKGFIGVAIAPQVNLGENSQVLLTTPQAAAFGAALGAAFAVVTWILRKMKDEG